MKCCQVNIHTRLTKHVIYIHIFNMNTYDKSIIADKIIQAIDENGNLNIPEFARSINVPTYIIYNTIYKYNIVVNEYKKMKKDKIEKIRNYLNSGKSIPYIMREMKIGRYRIEKTIKRHKLRKVNEVRTVTNLSKLMGVSRQTLYTWHSEGRIDINQELMKLA